MPGKLLVTSFAALALAGSAAVVFAQAYPTKPIRLVVGFTPEEFSKLFHEEIARSAEVVRVSGARAD